MTRPAPAAAWLALACTAVALPTVLAYNVSPSATFYNQVLALAGWGAWAVVLASALGPRLQRPAGGLGALLLALGLMALAAVLAPFWSGLTPALARSALGMIAAAALVAWIAASLPDDASRRAAFTAFCAALLLAGVAGSVVGLVQVFVPGWADGQWIAATGTPGRAVGNLRQPNHLASLLLWGIAAAVWLADTRALPRAAAALLAGAMLFVVVLTASRTGLVGAALLAAWGIADRRLARPSRLLLLAMPVLYALGWWTMDWWAQAGGHEFFGQARFSGGGDLSSSRFAIWKNTLSLIAMAPWTGVGFGGFNFAWTLTPFPDRPVAFFDHTHNLPLQLLVELGLPLGGAVLLLLIAAAGLALRHAARADGPAPPERTAVFMVLMIGVHSLLEYPLWYVYFLLPAAFAFGLCFGAPAVRGAVAGGHRVARAAAAAMLVGAALAVVDYLQVAAIFSASPRSAPLAQRIESGRASWFFAQHADYAAATTAPEPSRVMPAFDGATHNLLDTRLMIAWARAFDEAGDSERARHIAQRLREFRNADAQAFFAPCDTPAADTPEPPFQCRAPRRAMDWRDFR